VKTAMVKLPKKKIGGYLCCWTWSVIEYAL